MHDLWVFGYGSLIWRPDIAFRERRVARIQGWKRRFWQGSHDHRGVAHAPGRVVTLVPDPDASCEGMAYLIGGAVAESTFAGLDHREKNGYERHDVRLQFRDGETCAGVVYIAPAGNHAYLGPAPEDEMAEQIRRSGRTERHQHGVPAGAGGGAARTRDRRSARVRTRTAGAGFCGARLMS